MPCSRLSVTELDCRLLRYSALQLLTTKILIRRHLTFAPTTVWDQPDTKAETELCADIPFGCTDLLVNVHVLMFMGTGFDCMGDHANHIIIMEDLIVTTPPSKSF
jgi:hypothetical protein